MPDGAGFVPLEQVIAANLDLLFPGTPLTRVHVFRVTRGAEGDPSATADAETTTSCCPAASSAWSRAS